MVVGGVEAFKKCNRSPAEERYIRVRCFRTANRAVAVQRKRLQTSSSTPACTPRLPTMSFLRMAPPPKSYIAMKLLPVRMVEDLNLDSQAQEEARELERRVHEHMGNVRSVSVSCFFSLVAGMSGLTTAMA